MTLKALEDRGMKNDQQNKAMFISFCIEQYAKAKTTNIQSKECTQQQPQDLTESICQALREIKMMKEGKIKELSMDDLLDEI